MFRKSLYLSLLLGTSVSALAAGQSISTDNPADHFDLTRWKITLPMDADGNGKVDEIKQPDILSYSHPDFFYVDENKHLVFQVHNNAVTTKGSTNVRSELRAMLRGADKSIGTKDAKNNFALASHPAADTFGQIGGKLEATLRVNHTAKNAKHGDKPPAYSVVVGQIHASKDKEIIASGNGFGHGNEPLKIFFKKFPNHDTGSVFWNYERNLAKADPDRTDISYAVWGNNWSNSADPKETGLKLGDEFSYTVNVFGDIMYLTFTSEGRETKEFEINLANNADINGKVDSKDFAKGYAGDGFYFKAGAYGQCSVKDTHPVWGTGCGGTGNFDADVKTGDYSSVTFSKIVMGPSTDPKKAMMKK